jgi:hypothetical protein
VSAPAVVWLALGACLGTPASRAVAADVSAADTVLVNGEVLLFSGVEQRKPGEERRAPERPRFAEAIDDLLAVVKMHTINAAAQIHRERDIGSVEVGKYADLIVLGQNLFRVPTEQISETRVLMTMLGGRIVFDDGSLARP